MAITNGTSVGTTRQDLVSAIVQETLKAKSIYIPTVQNYVVPAGAKSLYIPRRSQFTAETKAEDTDLTSQALTFTQDQLTLTHLAVYAEVEKIAAVQSNVNVEGEVVKEIAAELAIKSDALIRAQLKLASASGPDHIVQFANTPTNTIQLVDVRNARKLMNSQYLPAQDRFMSVSVDQEYALLGLSDFIQAERYGSNEPIMNGEIGRIFGFKVIVDPLLAAAETLFWHKSACAFGIQLAVQYEKDSNLKGVKDEYLGHTVAGAKVLQGGKANVFINATGA